ncbi:YlbF family regulator [uncultured Streptococcus sp.]|uniref:YlbF family regulator n=1 Tax=uncultured Streptococcus sp. TaxID=83427 RepID=UPI0025F25C4C|nr:YlbF family regulator [uncultured Streptococcus sp.]
MLIINEELLAIDQAIDSLVLHFLGLPEVEVYRLKRQKFEGDRTLQQQLLEFQELRESYEEAQKYEDYRSDVRDLKRQVLRMKRQIDLNEVVIAYRQAELDLQEIMASLGQDIAQAVSDQIFIDTGLPLAPHKPHHKKGATNIKEKMSND